MKYLIINKLLIPSVFALGLIFLFSCGTRTRNVCEKKLDNNVILPDTMQISVNGTSFTMILVKTNIDTSNFYIGQTEVTQGMWKAVMSSSIRNIGERYGIGDNYPAYYVTYHDAYRFISTLNELTGLTFDFPSNEEWEYAAKGGIKSKGYKYSGSNNADEVAWYYDNSKDYKLHEVKKKKPNELGIYDMSGNVEEMTGIEPRKTLTKGGSIYGSEGFLEVTNNSWRLDDFSACMGFRIVLRCSNNNVLSFNKKISFGNESPFHPETLRGFGLDFVRMTESQIDSELMGKYYIHRPPEGAIHYPEHGSYGIEMTHHGMILYGDFVSQIFSPEVTRDILTYKEKIAKSAELYDGMWYKAWDSENNRMTYMLYKYQRKATMYVYENSIFIDKEQYHDEEHGGILFIHDEDDTWYYYSKKGSFPFKRKGGDF